MGRHSSRPSQRDGEKSVCVWPLLALAVPLSKAMCSNDMLPLVLRRMRSADLGHAERGGLGAHPWESDFNGIRRVAWKIHGDWVPMSAHLRNSTPGKTLPILSGAPVRPVNRLSVYCLSRPLGWPVGPLAAFVSSHLFSSLSRTRASTTSPLQLSVCSHTTHRTLNAPRPCVPYSAPSAPFLVANSPRPSPRFRPASRARPLLALSTPLTPSMPVRT
jgi:hypothetical protein